MRPTLLLVMLISLMISCKSTQDAPSAIVDNASINKRLTDLSNKMAVHLESITIDSTKIPRAIAEDGTLIAKNSRQWTSGFFPGTLWQLASHSQNEEILKQARTWSNFIEKEKWDTHTHDIGFKVNNTFGQWNKVEPSKRNNDIIVQASATLIKRFNENVKAIKSWDWGKERWIFPVIIDNMMNLEMLFDATDISGDSIYYQIADQHAQTTLANHFRENHSSYHVVDYDTITGAPRNKLTHQGLNDESTWARGQAWGLYGFAMAYDRTGNEAYFKKAKEIANLFFTHPNMPTDLIPYWDFDALNIPDEAKDVSAAAIAINGLMMLVKHDSENEEKYMKWVNTVIRSLEKEEYQTDKAPFLLGRSTGSVPDSFEVDVPISYGDYFYVQALLQRLDLEK